MPSKFLQRLLDQRSEYTSQTEAILARAADENRDLTEAERANIETLARSSDGTDEQIKVAEQVETRNAAAAEVARRVGPLPGHSRSESTAGAVAVAESPKYRSAGEWVADWGRAFKGDSGAHDRLTRAAGNGNGSVTPFAGGAGAGDQTTDKNPGLLPEPILGPVINILANVRPTINSITSRPLPGAGKTFYRPHVTQHTTVTSGVAEKSPYPTTPLHVDQIQVDKQTFGGWVNISFQDRDWTEPSIMDALLSDLAAVYARATNAFAAAALVAGAGSSVGIGTGEGDFIRAVYEAAEAIYSETNLMPSTLWLAPDVWGDIGGLLDASGRPLFPELGPQNAPGQLSPSRASGNVLGLGIVVDAGYPSGFIAVGSSYAQEWYEQQGGQVSVVEPSVLGFQLAFYGYGATVVTVPEALVKLTGSVTPAPTP